MGTPSRRERERAERHQLIITTARKLAATQGWDAVTTRRLSTEIEYSQPVLYSHFTDKRAIVAAVALEGFAELATVLRAARKDGAEPAQALRAVADAYLQFAESEPALYDAMFTLGVGLPFGDPGELTPLSDAFAELRAVAEPLAGGQDVELFTEVVWSSLHGLVTLTQNHRLRPNLTPARLQLMVDRLLT
jgi:AcrR family transcriptional regulator